MADVKHRDTRRRFEQWAGNPHCEANTVSAVHGIKMADVARSEGIEPTFGQSPFAIARGQAFERGLFAKGAAKRHARRRVPYSLRSPPATPTTVLLC
jgi:hypothetical protein